MTGPAIPPDLDRLLSAATVPAMSADLIDRIVVEAGRPGRVALPVPSRRRSRVRWARRGVRSGIVVASLMLATAVAAAFGGGALTFAKLAVVAQHVVQHIRHPFHHAEPVAPVRRAAIRRLTVPPALIRTTPGGGVPMTMPRAVAAAPPVMRPMVAPHRTLDAMAHPMPRMPIDRHPPAVRTMPHALRAARPAFAHRADRPIRHAPLREDRPVRSEAHVPAANLDSPHLDPPRRDAAPAATVPTEPVARDGGLARDGGTRFDGPRWQNPARTGDVMRRPGWRRMQNGGANAPGWRRQQAMMGGGAQRGGLGRGRPFRPGGGRRPRRF